MRRGGGDEGDVRVTEADERGNWAKISRAKRSRAEKLVMICGELGLIWPAGNRSCDASH